MLERNGKKWNNLQQRKYEAVRKRMKFNWKHQDMESNTLSKFSFFFPPPLECTRECWKSFQSDSKLLRPKVVNFNFHPTPRFQRLEKRRRRKRNSRLFAINSISFLLNVIHEPQGFNVTPTSHFYGRCSNNDNEPRWYVAAHI